MLSILNLTDQSARKGVTITKSPETLQLMAILPRLRSPMGKKVYIGSSKLGTAESERVESRNMGRILLQDVLSKCLLDKSFILGLPFCGNVHSLIFPIYVYVHNKQASATEARTGEILSTLER